MWAEAVDPLMVEVARRWDDNQEYLKQMLGPSRVREFGAYWVLMPEVPYPKFNHVSGIRIAEEQVPAFFQMAETFFRGAGLPSQGFMCTPATEPRDLGARLWCAGYSVETNPVMLLRRRRAMAVNPAVQVYAVGREQAEDLWSVMLPVFFAGGSPTLLGSGRRSIDTSFDLGMINYVAVVEGQIAGTGSLFRRGGIGGVYNMATLPKFRGCGVASAVLQRILADSAAAGDPHVALTPTPQAQRMYGHHGFEVLYHERYYGMTMPTARK